jgi:hypothetical protein
MFQESSCTHVTNGQTETTGHNDLVAWQLGLLSTELMSAVNLTR